MDDKTAVGVVLEAAERIRQLTDHKLEDAWMMTPGDASTAAKDSQSPASRENTNSFATADEYVVPTDPMDDLWCESCQ